MAVAHTLPQLAALVPTIQRTAERAGREARQAEQELQNEALGKSVRLEALRLARSGNATISGLGRAGLRFLDQGKSGDATLFLATGRRVEALREVERSYPVYAQQEWTREFHTFAARLATQGMAGPVALGAEWREAVRVYAGTLDLSIDNVGRVETLRALSQRNNPFIREQLPGVMERYREGDMEGGDRALFYLDFYDRTWNRKDARILDGKAEVQEGVRLAIGGKERAELSFQTGVQKFQMAQGCEQMAEHLQGEYAKLKEAYGPSQPLEQLLTSIVEDLKKRKMDAADKKIDLFYSQAQAFAKEQREIKRAELERNLEGAGAVLGSLRDQVEAYRKAFPEETRQLLARLDEVERRLGATLKGVKKAGEKPLGEKEADALQKQLERFSEGYLAVCSLVPTMMVAMNTLQAERGMGAVLERSQVPRAYKNPALRGSRNVQEYLEKSLEALLEEGAGSARARAAFEHAMQEKAGILALLRLREEAPGIPFVTGIPDIEKIGRRAFDRQHEPREEFRFFQDASMHLYDRAVVGKGMKPEEWHLAGALYRLESSVRQAEDKFFAHGEVPLQDRIVEDSRLLLAHYTGALPQNAAWVHTQERNILENAGKLSKKIARAETANEVAKFIGSFIHPSILFTVAVESTLREYQVRGEVSWTNVALLAAAALAFRHSGSLSGTLEAFKGTAGMRVITGMEGLLAGGLVVHGGIEAYHDFREGRWKDGLLKIGMFGLPLAYATVRTPVMRALGKTYQRFTADRVLLALEEVEAVALPKGVEMPRTLRMQPSEGGFITVEMPAAEAATVPRAPRAAQRRAMVEGETAAGGRPRPAETALAEAPTTPRTQRGIGAEPREPGPIVRTERDIAFEPTGPAAPQRTQRGRPSEPTELQPARPMEQTPGEIRPVGQTRRGAPETPEVVVEAQRAAAEEAAALNKTALEAEAHRVADRFRGDIIEKKKAYKGFLKTSAEQQEWLVNTLRLGGEHEMAARLAEVRMLGALERKLGMRPGGLSDGYTGAWRLIDAREELLMKLYAKTKIRMSIDPGADPEMFPHVFPNLYSMLSGNLLEGVQAMLPAGSKITGIKYNMGLVGTFRVTVKTPQGERAYFLKPQDARADRLGAELGREAGVPTPAIATEAGGRPLEGIGPDGRRQVWGLSEDIRRFEGALPIAGRGVEVSTVEAESLRGLGQNERLTRVLQENPEVFGEELGFSVTGTTSIGMWDGHESNLYAMLLRVSEQDAAFLESKGYKVFREPEGPCIFRIGRIDTDSGASFRATRNVTGYDFGSMFTRVGGEDLRRVFKAVGWPQGKSIEQIMTELEPHLRRGAARWQSEVGGNPEFRMALVRRLEAHEGQPVGMGQPLTPEQRQWLEHGRMEWDTPFNGSPRTPVGFADGHARLNARDAIETTKAFLRDGAVDDFRQVWNRIFEETRAEMARIQAQLEAAVAGAGARPKTRVEKRK